MQPLTTASKPIGLLKLVMINVIAVDSLRNISITARAGWLSVSFYIIAGLFFLLPCAMITARMAAKYQNNGGVYLWSKSAFGSKIGFMILWLQWIYNLVWFPSICMFLAGIIAYLISCVAPIPIDINKLISNPFYAVSCSLVIFWSATIVNMYGIRISSNVILWGL